LVILVSEEGTLKS